MELKTNKGEYFLIDDEDYELVKDITWCKNARGYIRGWCKNRKKRVSIHRLIMGVFDSRLPFVDHITGEPIDNRKSNLRFCTYSENNKNRKASGKSKFLGVSKHTSNTKYKLKCGTIKISSRTSFRCTLHIKKKQIHLGLFDDEIDAAKAYNEAAIKYHGEFARLNTFKD